MRLQIAQLLPEKNQPVTSKSVTYSSVLAADSGLYTVEKPPASAGTKIIHIAQSHQTQICIGELPQNALDYRRLQLEGRIEDEFAFGHLTKNQLIKPQVGHHRYLREPRSTATKQMA